MCFCESGDKAKIRVIKPEFKMIQYEVKTGLKKVTCDYGPYTTVSKELNSMIWYILNQKTKKKASSFILE
jgi:hypothetical protein